MDYDPSNNNGPMSPKKKLHCKNKETLSESVQHVRADLKNARDISARNLMAHCNDLGGDSSTATSDGDSTVEEVVTIEEVTEYTDNSQGDVVYVEEEVTDDEYEEEVVEDGSYDSDDSELEPLPPPITIPKALQVKDSDDEGPDNSSDNEYSDDESEVVPAPAPKPKEQVIQEPKERPSKLRGQSCYTEEERKKQQKPAPAQAKAAVNAARPGTFRGLSCYDEDPTVTEPVKKHVPRMDSFEEVPEAPKQEAVTPTTPTREVASKNPTRKVAPKPPKREVAPKTPKQKVAPKPARQEVVPKTPEAEGAAPKTPVEPARAMATSSSVEKEDDRLAWKKPDWTKNTSLRSTGKSAAENLAKPITQLPHMKKHTDDDDEERKPAAVVRTTAPVNEPANSRRQTPTKQPKKKVERAKENSGPRTPTNTQKKKVELLAEAPKSAPTVRRLPVAASVDDASLPKIEWEKPEWAKKKVLRDTSKGAKVLEGKSIARPIGGIRPLD